MAIISGRTGAALFNGLLNRAGAATSHSSVGPNTRETPYQRALKIAIATEGLRKRDITVAGRRTSMKLDDANWNALTAVALVEGVSVDVIATEIQRKMDNTHSLTSAIRVFIVAYLSMTAEQA